MNLKVEIDNGSGFCFGVTTAIRKAEEELAKGCKLYCLGDIVHNDMEVERLHDQGLETIDHEQLKSLHNAKVLLRAHGEPPKTYDIARQNNIEIIDATCPVVLALQRRIKLKWCINREAQTVIFGKKGHAEVLGLVGQTHGEAIVVENLEEVKEKIDLSKDINLYSQTTKNLDEYRHIIDYIQSNIDAESAFKSYDTICRQVANRMPHIADFAAHHDIILFVCGRKSSNGHALFTRCKEVNINSHLVERKDEIDFSWFDNAETVGICGATSTPKWLMEECKDAILSY